MDEIGLPRQPPGEAGPLFISSSHHDPYLLGAQGLSRLLNLRAVRVVANGIGGSSPTGGFRLQNGRGGDNLNNLAISHLPGSPSAFDSDTGRLRDVATGCRPLGFVLRWPDAARFPARRRPFHARPD